LRHRAQGTGHRAQGLGLKVKVKSGFIDPLLGGSRGG